MSAEPAFFIDDFRCHASCDPDDHNPLHLFSPVEVDRFGKALRITDVTTGRGSNVDRPPDAGARSERFRDDGSFLTLEDACFNAQPPATTYAVTVDPGLQSLDGQVLGYTWVGSVANWHRTAFSSFGDGHGVREAGGGAVLPFYARNLFSVKQWAAAVKPDDLMPTVHALTPKFVATPAAAPIERKLSVTQNRIQSYGFDVSKALGPNQKGIVWAAVENGAMVDKARTSFRPLHASLIQVTNLGGR